MRAILVDDEEIMLRSFLRQCKGFDDLNIIGVFRYPEEAEVFAKGSAVDLAILDVEMPVMNGIELARRLRLIYPDILIVFISAYEESSKKLAEIEMDYFITKPYTRDTIEGMVDRMRILCFGRRDSPAKNEQP